MLSAGDSMSVAEPKKRNEEERMATWLAKDMVSVAAHLHATLSGAISTPAGASEIDRLEAATQLLIPLEEEMEVGLVDHPQAISFLFIISALAGTRHDGPPG